MIMYVLELMNLNKLARSQIISGDTNIFDRTNTLLNNKGPLYLNNCCVDTYSVGQSGTTDSWNNSLFSRTPPPIQIELLDRMKDRGGGHGGGGGGCGNRFDHY